jgi:hypothetical protein
MKADKTDLIEDIGTGAPEGWEHEKAAGEVGNKAHVGRQHKVSRVIYILSDPNAEGWSLYVTMQDHQREPNVSWENVACLLRCGPPGPPGCSWPMGAPGCS